eukprot:SAG11_NODE_1851_length_4167_cov_1.585054_3_plen_62_part_00
MLPCAQSCTTLHTRFCYQVSQKKRSLLPGNLGPEVINHLARVVKYTVCAKGQVTRNACILY